MPEGILHGGMEGWQRRAAHLWPWLCMESGAGNLLSCPVMTQPCALVPWVLQEVPQPGRVHHSVPQDIPLPCPAGRIKLYFMERYYSLKNSQWTNRSVNFNFIFLLHYPRDTTFNRQTLKQSWPPWVHHLLPNTHQPLAWRERWGHTVEFRNANSTFMLPSNQGCCVTTAREGGQLT